MLFDQILLLALAGSAGAAALPESAKVASKSTKVPQYFQTSPELWAGPTATGKAPFLAETNPVSFAPTATFVPNTPLETAEPIVGQGQNQSIFQLMGQLSPYFPNPEGFGVSEFPLPPGANISQVQVRNIPLRYVLLLTDMNRCFLVTDRDTLRQDPMWPNLARKLPIVLGSSKLLDFCLS